MGRARVIPVLLLENRKLVKTKKFRSPVYVGDPLNALKIFNEKEVDELVILDISAHSKKTPDFDFIADLVSECFMPISYGGGIVNFEQAQRLFSIGIEKVVLGSVAFDASSVITLISNSYGAQSVAICIDVKKYFFFGNQVCVQNGNIRTGMSPLEFAQKVQNLGAGEIILQSVDLDGTRVGYDLNLIKQVSDSVNLPVVALGGAGKVEDLKRAVTKGGASGVAAGSMFVFQGLHQAVLISYVDAKQLDRLMD